MRREQKYYLILGAALLLLLGVELFAPKPTDWTFSLHNTHKGPYGTYILKESMPYIFPDRQLNIEYRTLYELKDSGLAGKNILILSGGFAPDKQDTEVIWNMLKEGSHILASARQFGGPLADTLQLETEVAFKELISESADSLRIPESLYYFSDFDSSRFEVLATNKKEQAVLLSLSNGKGRLMLSSVPQLYTNYYMVQDSLHKEAVQSLAFLPVRDLVWNEYYHRGRMQSTSPLRFFLSTSALKWAVYITVLGLLLFVLFESKRRQRAIAVIEPPRNTTLEFVQTVSNLFIRSSDHEEMARKKLVYFRQYLLSHYRLEGEWQDDKFREKVAHKTAKPRDEIDKIFDLILQVQRKTITTQELILLNQQIDTFYPQEEII
ncbi:hypothetical protein PZB74_07300 [Porifericola rhodea]|uniref:hypothetical protein n=1 Tax=Porifericola rhodea TaxID=930972 RepID=UPI00266701DE|nr:hypothetical protein [Porifericola rhodea]WKN33149.1 hypothetical protein PZB74_07300 [Porifericola rhodea]